MNKRLNKMAWLVMVAGLAFAAISAQAQGWPSRPVKLILGVSPGGLQDVSARLIAADLATRLRQPVIVENRPGANSTIAANAVAQATPDGYTFFYGGVMTPSPVFVKNNGVDAATQLKPVSMVLSAPFFLVVNAKVPANTMQELVAYSQKNPGKLNFGDGAALSTMVMEAVASRTGLNFTSIPYKGSAPSMQALLAGEVDMTLDTVPTYLQHIESGKLRALMNTSRARSPILPNVPSAAEIKGLDINAASVLSLWAPAGTPDIIVRKLSTEIAAMSKAPEFRAKFKKSTNVDPIGSTPDELMATFLADKALYTSVARQIKYEPQ